jgi:antitoxin component of MazEF toxin-antitoxin module
MVRPVKVRKVGTYLGVVLPKEILTELGLGEDDELHAVRIPDGVLLTAHDPETQEVLEDTRDFMHRHAGTMKKLAES